jgi:catechol 2,3-dioxygenase-like lactoylglutathione lyase family enzyme
MLAVMAAVALLIASLTAAGQVTAPASGVRHGGSAAPGRAASVAGPRDTRGRVPIPVAAVDSIGMTVSDMERAVDFYTSVLSFERVSDVEVAGREYELLSGVLGARMRVVRLRLGGEAIELTEFLAPKGRPIPPDMKANDRAFQHIAIIVRDMDEAYARLRAAGVVHASTGPQTLPAWNRDAAGIRAFYFRDPDGHFLEILHFPPGKGDAKWHRSDRLFLGIDHTAMVAGDTDRSLRLYRDALGLAVAGTSENYDMEQEHLNNVFGARLRITTLRAAAGPGIELLEYLAPRDGRPAPADLRANDITHWQTTLVTELPEQVFGVLPLRVVSLVSPVAVTPPTPALGVRRAVLVRDADGHAIRLAAR